MRSNMKEKGIIIYNIFLLCKTAIALCEDNDTNNAESKRWLIWGEPFGCERGHVAVNSQNKKPVKGACVPMGYDVSQSPYPDSLSKIYTSFIDHTILSVEEADHTFTVELKSSSIWEDPRIQTTLKNKNSFLKLSPDVLMPSVWLPTQILPSNMKKFKPTLDPLLYVELRFFLDSRISTSSTLINFTMAGRYTIYCDYDFKMFPFDTHICKLSFSSWDPDKLQPLLYDPENYSLHSKKNYKRAGFDVSIDFRNYTNGVGLNIQLKRLTLPYVLQYYLPCFSIVMISFISFIVPLSAIPGRIGLTVTQFLTLTNVFIHQMVSLLASSIH